MSIIRKIDAIKETLAQAVKMAESFNVDAFEIHCSIDQGHVIGVRNQLPETLEFNLTQHLGIEVYYQGRTGYAETTDLSTQSLRSVVQNAVTIARHTEKDPFSGIVKKGVLTQAKRLDYLYRPWQEFTIENAIEQAKACEAYALKEKDIFRSDGVTINSFEMLHGFANSHGFLDVYPETKHSISAEFIAKDKHGMQRDDAYYVNHDFTALPTLQQIAEKAISRTLARRNPRHIKSGNLPVIFSPNIASAMIGNLLAALKGSRQYHKNTFLYQKLNEKVIAETISIIEKPDIIGAIASRPYDDEGVNKGTSPIITGGKVERYLLSSYSARQLKLETTGNAGGISNIEIVTRHKCCEKEMISNLKEGVLIHETMGRGVSLTTGNYSQGAMGFYIENGEIQYPIDNFTVVGNLNEMLNNIQGIAYDNIDTNTAIRIGSMLIENCFISGE